MEMKCIRIFFLILIVIGVVLLATQTIWVPQLVSNILWHEGYGTAVFTDLGNVAVVRNSTPIKPIALTFDDGPYGTSTEEIVAILEQKKVPATFFLVGKNIEQYPQQVGEEVRGGFVVGNHSYSHSKFLVTMASNTLSEDVQKAQILIEHNAGRAPHLFRAPYGSISSGMVNEIKHEGYVFVAWNVDPRDWDNSNSSTTILNSILKNTKENSIILLHDGHENTYTYSRENTIAALPAIIDDLRKEGYTFVTVDKILSTNPYRGQ